MLTDLFDLCREVNQYLGPIAVVFVVWRGLPLAITRIHSSWPIRHRVLIFHVTGLYALAGAVGAIHYEHGLPISPPASPGAPLFTLALIGTILLCIFWPVPLRREDEQ